MEYFASALAGFKFDLRRIPLRFASLQFQLSFPRPEGRLSAKNFPKIAFGAEVACILAVSPVFIRKFSLR
jgi:hypothetical protein